MRKVHLTVVMLLLLVLHGSSGRSSSQAPATSFAAQVASLSEPGGYFDTDNLISNERSYLEVLPDLAKRGVTGGAYLGVGPDQNFTYIAAIKPEVAFIVDVRRDNLLLHLLFKALFDLSRSRAEYLALLVGRPLPDAPDAWKDAAIDKILAHVEGPPLDARAVGALRTRVDEAIKRFGLTLGAEDFETIDRFHRRFIEAGVQLRFQSTGRPPQSHYPTYADLLRETDPRGRPGNYLASEPAFQFVKELQRRHLIIPVVGDLSGPKAVRAIGEVLTARRTRVTTFYVSNVEYYLYGSDRFPEFMANLGRLPRAERAVVIRSIFGRSTWTRGGSASQLHSMSEMIDGYSKGRFHYYTDLIGWAR
jgi:hypothetical protein